MEGHLGGVDLVVGAVVHIGVNADHRVAAQGTGLHRVLDTGVHCRDVFLRDRAADDRALEGVQVLAVRIAGSEDDLAVTVLAVAAGLLGVLELLVDLLAEGLLVRDLRSADVRFDVELTQQTVDDDLQMQLAHASDDGLAGLGIGVLLEGRVFLGQLREGVAQLVLAGLGLRLDRELDDRLREFHGLQDDRVLLVAERVARAGELQADGGRDIAGVDLVDLLSLVGVHLKDTRDALLLALHRIQHVGAGIQCAGVDAEVRELSDEGVGHDLEGQSREGLLIGGLAVVFVAVEVGSLDRRDVGRSRHELDDRVQKLLNALVSVSRAAADRDRGARDAALAERSLHFFHRGFLALQIHHHQVLVEVADLLHELRAPLLGLILHILGDRFNTDILSVLPVVIICLHLEQIDDPLELGLFADRDLEADRILAKTGDQLIDGTVEVRADDVHLVHKRHTRDVVLVRLAPYIFRLRFYAALGIKDADRAVQDAERALHLHREIHVAGGVDDVDAVLQSAGGRLALFFQRPVAGRRSGGNGNASLLLLLHPVHGSGTFMGLADLVVDAGIVQDTLCQSRLTGIDMSHDTDISCSFQRIFSSTSHVLPSLESVVAERLVRLSHLMHIFFSLHRRTGVVDGVEDLVRETVFHLLLGSLAGEHRQPAERQRLSSVGADFDRDLIGRAADTSRLDLEDRHDVVHRLLKGLYCRFPGLLFYRGKCVVHDLLGYALLAVQHDVVDQLGDQLAVVHRIC